MTDAAPAPGRATVAPSPGGSLLSAELLSVGTELTVGDTRDTNAGELAKDLVGARRRGSAA